MTKSTGPGIWDLASVTELAAALRGAGVALGTQDTNLRYTAGINLPLSADPREVAGLSEQDIDPAGSSALHACKERVAATGKAENVEIGVRHGGQTHWHRVWVEPLGNSEGRHGVLSIAVDNSAEKAAREDLRLALLELAHRSKNLLAVVLSIARQSADDSPTLPEFSTRFVGRIRSLALAHDVLTDESWRGATVFSLVNSQLSAFSAEAAAKSTIEGHNAYLKPNAVQYVGLALHELIAMSLLTGALSSPDGHIDVASTLAPAEDGSGGALVLRWHETGLSRPVPPPEPRFGHALLERIVPAALNGSANLDLSDSHSLAYELRMPATQFF